MGTRNTYSADFKRQAIQLAMDGGDLEMRIDHFATMRSKQQAQQQLDALNQGAVEGGINL